MKKPDAEELERMREARCASLIRRWLAGKKLSDSEKGELAHIIPLPIIDQGPESPAGRQAVKALSTRKHAKYPKTYPEYSRIYGVEETGRVVKRWVRRGKELSDLPPLDTPQEMAAWWRRCMDNQVPDNFLGFIKAEGIGELPAQPPGISTQPRDFSKIQTLGIEENVQELRHTHAINKHLLDESLHAAEPNENTIALRQRNYERSFELLRKAESTLIELQKQRGKLIDEESVRNELSQLLESVRMMRETMPRRIVTELEKILPRRFVRILGALEKYLLPAVEKTRADEENIFRNLETLDGPESVQKLLAA